MMNKRKQLEGKKIVFTGMLHCLKREEAIEIVKAKGAIVQTFVTVQTDILVLAPKQLDIFNSDRRSRKQVRAESLILEGFPIKIIGEKEFLDLING